MSGQANLVWRTFVPEVVSAPWNRFEYVEKPPVERFSDAVAGLDLLGRYLVALFAPLRRDALGVPEFKRLVGKLDQATLGMWWAAAAGLAKELRPREGGIADVAKVLSQPGISDLVDDLILGRNQAVHRPDGGVGLSETEARREIDNLSPLIHRLKEAFLPLGAVRLFATARVEQLDTGENEYAVLVFGAADTLHAQLTLTGRLVKEHVYAVGRLGEPVDLFPWLRVVEGPRGPTAALLHGRATADGVLWTVPRAEPFVGARPEGLGVAPPPAPRLDPRATQRLCDVGLGAAVPVVPGWKLLSRLGGGASADVWRAEPADGGEARALKIARRDRLGDAELVQRMALEAEASRRVRHPNLVRTYELQVSEDGRPVLVMDLVEGSDLAAELASDAPPSPPDFVRWMRDVARGLETLHANGLLHRDLKPANVRLRPDGGAVLVDLGLVLDQGAARATRVGRGVGTLGYAAPEQVEGRAVSDKADVYALGRMIQDWVRCRFGPAGEGAPAALVALARRATAQDPSARPSAAEALAELLRKDLLQDARPVARGDRLPNGWRVIGDPEPSPKIEGAWRVPVRDSAGSRFLALVGTGSATRDPLRQLAKARQLAIHESESADLVMVRLQVPLPGAAPAAPVDMTSAAVGAGVGAAAFAGSAALLGAAAIGGAVLGRAVAKQAKGTTVNPALAPPPPAPSAAGAPGVLGLARAAMAIGGAISRSRRGPAVPPGKDSK